MERQAKWETRSLLLPSTETLRDTRDIISAGGGISHRRIPRDLPNVRASKYRFILHSLYAVTRHSTCCRLEWLYYYSHRSLRDGTHPKVPK